MSADGLITSMEKLLQLHNSLFEIAQRKTDVIKKGDIAPLNQILKEEQALIAVIDKTEKIRIQAARNSFPGMENPTVMDCIERMSGDDKEHLVEVASSLTTVVSELKERNLLNQQLIYQSLQFVNFSLNLLIPQQESINYGPNIGAPNIKGIFNSEA